MEFVILIGRILFGMLFFAAALGHLTQTSAIAAYAEARGVPQARMLTQVSGLAIVAGAASVVFGVFADAGALVLAVFLIATAVTIHTFWDEPEGDARTATQTQFMKDMALAGGALIMFGFFVHTGDALGFTLTGPLF